ncbi:hypothetical protein FZEAL_1023 [Fusarium zealandicum]|uniref:Uncharacterized protein n=1 Tax=Fusarium zealandicum TaxID=1053134 RepID=A0A8H4UU11_9HYPO|nr:hypothetical protein FZEAL_1023 [Fusarium zealandicum]
MAKHSQTVLLIGATSGIGEEMARQYHAAGKKVIISGRRLQRLNQLKSELAGVEAIQMDIEALDSIPSSVEQAFSQFPSIDSIIIVAGQQNYYNFNSAQPPPVSGKGAPDTPLISSEITTNLTAPIILSREIVKHVVSGSRADKPFTLGFVTAGLAFVPIPIFPIYCASKAALHSFIVTLRAQLAGTNMNLVEIVPPYVKTELDLQHYEILQAASGGNLTGQDVGEYVAGVLRGMDEVDEDGNPPKYVAEGFPRIIVNTWVNAFSSLAKNFGLSL